MKWAINLVVVIGMSMGLVWAADYVGVVDVFEDSAAQAPTITPRDRTVQQLQAASELTTYKFVISTQIPISQSRKVLGFDVESQLLYVVQGTVNAGVDVSQAQVTDDAIVLPAAQILSVVVNPEQSGTYTYDQGTFNLGPDAMDLRELAEEEAVLVLQQAACDQSILDLAGEQAIAVVRQLTGIQNVSIQDGACDEGSSL